MRTRIMQWTRRLSFASLVLPVLLLRMSVTTETANQNFWQPTNGPYGGYISSVVINSQGHIFVGAYGSGVFVSTDNGASWDDVNNGLTDKRIYALAMNAAGHLFAGTRGSGVFRSTDNGNTWTQKNNGLMNKDILTLALNAAGHLFAGTNNGGVFRTMDNGNNWVEVNNGLMKKYVAALAINPAGHLFAGTTAGGVFRSIDNGNNWTEMNIGLPDKTVHALAINPGTGDIFAGTSSINSSFSDGSVYRSKDNGNTWMEVNAGLKKINVRSFVINAKGVIFAGLNDGFFDNVNVTAHKSDDGGVFRSMDNGNTWIEISSGLTNKFVWALAINHLNGDLWAGTRGGVFRLTNNGTQWAEVNTGLTGFNVTSLVVNSDGHVFAGIGRSGFGCGGFVFRSTNSGNAWEKSNAGLTNADVNILAINAERELFAGTAAGLYRSTDNGNTWTFAGFGGGWNGDVAAVAINSSGHIFAGTENGSIARSIDNGKTWTYLSFNTGLIIRYLRVLMINASGHIFAGVDVGVLRSMDNGSTWTASNTGLTNQSVQTLFINASQDLFAGTAGGIFRSTNNGDMWTDVNNGLANKEVLTLAGNSGEDIFAGTNGGGVFRSSDNGDHWNEINAGLTRQIVYSLAFDSNKVIYAGTHGGVFRSVAPTSREARVVNSNAAPGSTVSVPIELVAQGDENALGFTLNFDPAILINPQARLGKDASTASLNTNVGSGRLGIALALPAGQKVMAGIREIVAVTFSINANTTANFARLEFGDQPIAREAVDVNGKVLTATWSSGTVTISRGLEADIAPRPNGNGSVTISDWVQAGRFAAGLDAVRTEVNEFQRADCAPKPCGDGRIGISDWVQAGRYAARLDAVANACGPMSATSAPNAAAKAMTKANAGRTVQIVNPNFQPNQMHTVTIELDAQGDENAIGFSLGFAPTVLTFKSAVLGSGASGATLNVNSSQTATGLLGLALALPAGQTFVAGMRRQFVLVSFSVNSSTSATSTPIEFKDQPIAREVVDVNGNPLQATWLVVTSVQERLNELPTTFELNANHPNPFNPSTTIKYELPQAVDVKLVIYDMMGRHVRTLVNQTQPAGRYAMNWDGRNEQGQAVASGTFIYQLRAGSFVQRRKMALIR